MSDIKIKKYRGKPEKPDPKLGPTGEFAWAIEHAAIPVRKPSGGILIDGKQVADTLQCVHCGCHWIPVRGSGIIRGWCHKCNGPICGIACAQTCISKEKLLDILEGS